MGLPLRDHWLPDALLEVSVTLPPAQKVVGPPGVIVGAAGSGLTVTAVMAEAALARLTALLAAHEASDGLGYLAPGTTTNNRDTASAAGPSCTLRRFQSVIERSKPCAGHCSIGTALSFANSSPEKAWCRAGANY